MTHIKMKPSLNQQADLLNKYSVTGCDIVELRAIFAALVLVCFLNDGKGEKEAWRRGVREKLKDLTRREAAGSLTPNEIRHSAYRTPTPTTTIPTPSKGKSKRSSGGGGGKSGGGGDGQWMVQGPFDPSLPLLRVEAIESSAFDATPQPAGDLHGEEGEGSGGGGEGGSQRKGVREVQEMLRQRQREGQQQVSADGADRRLGTGRMQQIQAILQESLLPPPPVSGQRGASLGHGERQQLQERASSIVHLSTEGPAAAESEATQQQHAPPEDGGFWEWVSQDAEKKQKRWFWF